MTPEKQKEILDAFNAVRRNVDPPASNMLKMIWSDEATESASRWASTCQFRNSPIEERSFGDIACGETISQSATAISWPDVIKQWARTKTNFKYGIGPVDPRKSVYTYTQLIWYNSHKVGCAVAYCSENTFPYLYLCHYCPSGNAQDKIATPYKKGLPCADCPSDCDNKLCTKGCEYTNSYNHCAKIKDRFSCESWFMAEMHLPVILLPLAAMLHLSLSQGGKGLVLNLSEKQQKEIIDTYNSIRRNVLPTASNMLKMSWNEEAAASAKAWAQQCVGKISPMKERTVDGLLCGESLSQATFSRSWSDVIRTWNSSSAMFEYGKEKEYKEQMRSFAYTQMIWYSSHMIGCSFAYCQENEYPYIYICRYCPVGNILETITTPYKSGPSCGDCPQNCEDKLCTNPCKYRDNHLNCANRIKEYGCEQDWVHKGCKASCECQTEIK
ncbi:hypothetical protein JRQ81_001636 [Phrynocephalus forsythii]|uniref:ShKT domain-containing protein n=1 Tax=Phrynocephalus forsythii TaxID=171643 RepID=A0A9Q0YAN5_9SAUR|nr:hypothetical protein JRQ81_001636 [Phrynocephalus forsythii]